MKPIKKMILLILVFVMLFSVDASAAGLNKTKATVYKGKSVTLKLRGSKGKITWKSSNRRVAGVSKKGKVTAKAAGSCVITAKTKSGKRYRCEIRVIKPHLSRTQVTLTPGQTIKLTLKGAGVKSWKSSNKAIASISKKGVVKAKKTGSIKVTCKGKDKKTYTCRIMVVPAPVQILFVGNSKTYVGDIPGQFAGLCKAAGRNVEVSTVAVGGCSLQQLAQEKAAEIKAKPFDYVIMQEQTQVGNFGTEQSTFTLGAKEVASLVRGVNPNVKLVVRDSWANSTDEETARQWRRDAALQVAGYIGASVARDNIAMYTAQEKGYAVFGDKTHQSELGAYLSACCVYKAIYGSPVGNSYTGAAGTFAGEMQKIADR